MKISKDDRLGDAAELRSRAKEITRRKAQLTKADVAALSPDEMRVKLHELQVHQIELELQNEELRITQVALNAARERYFDFYNLAPVGYCSVSEHGLILETNLIAATLLGIDRNAIVKQPITRFIHGDDQDIYYRHLKQLFKTREPQTCELRMVKTDGTLIWVHLTTTTAQDISGAPVSRVVMSDITVRKQDEEELRESYAYIKAVMDNLPLGIAVNSVDTDVKFSYMNDNFPKYYRTTRDALVGQDSFWDVVYEDPDFREKIRKRVLDDCAIGDPELMHWEDIPITRKGDETTFISAMNRPIPGKKLMISTVWDVTERKKSDKDLRNLLEEKDSLLNEVHHRVKNNLQIIASLLGLQASRSTSREVVDVLELNRNRVKSMALLHEVLYSTGNLARINFSTYVRDLCGQLLLSFGQVAGRVKLEYRIMQVGLPLENSVPCGLIVNELVSNALKHGFPGERTGRITVGLEPADGRMLVLSVCDDGAGLPAGLDPAGSATLGLQLVSILSDQLGGELEVGPPHGPGAAFSVKFPVPENTLIEGES